MDYEVLYNLDQQHTAVLEPAPASIALNGLTTEIPRTEIAVAELWENTDLGDYQGLGAAQRQAYGVLVALGTIDVSEGTNSRTALAALFPAGSTTRDNLVALVQLPVEIGLLASVGLPNVSAREIETARARYGG